MHNLQLYYMAMLYELRLDYSKFKTCFSCRKCAASDFFSKRKVDFKKSHFSTENKNLLESPKKSNFSSGQKKKQLFSYNYCLFLKDLKTYGTFLL